MGILSFPNDTSGARSGSGELIYLFRPTSGAEYNTPLLADDGLYEISVHTAEPQRQGGITIEVYTTDLTNPVEISTVFDDSPIYYPQAITKIKILNGTYATTSDASSLKIKKYLREVPPRTGNDNDGFGDIFVHVEAHGDWTNNGTLNQGESGYGWASPRKWVGWTYSYNMEGVYRIGRNNEVTNAKTFQYKPLDSMTWTNLTPIPDEIQFHPSTPSTADNRLTRAHMYDTENDLYVIFRCRDTQTHAILGNTAAYNHYLAKYNKALETWTFIGAYNISTLGDPTHTFGPQKFFIADNEGGTSFLYPWQLDRTSNTFFRYNLTTGERSSAAAGIAVWNDAVFVNGRLFCSPVNTIGNVDDATTNYSLYNPVNDSWSSVSPPQRTGEAITWFRGGSPFRFSETEVGIIGRRTYTTNSTAPGNTDRFWDRRIFTWDRNAPTETAWTDRSDLIGDFYPNSMRPSNAIDNERFTWQGLTSDWNARFLMLPNGESRFRTRGFYEYINVLKPKQVTVLGSTGRARGEMSVGSWSVLAFGHIRSVEQTPITFQTNNSSTTYSTETATSYATWGWELIFVDGTVKYGPQHVAPQNVIYNPKRNQYHISGWESVFSQAVSTTSVVGWTKVSYIVDEKTGISTKIWSDFYDAFSGNRALQEAYSSGLVYNDATHFYRPLDTDSFSVNSTFGWAGQGSEYRNKANGTEYRWYSNFPSTDTQRQSRVLSMASASRTNQVVWWGDGPRNVFGIPEGTVFWDGSTLRQYSWRFAQAPFSDDLAARSTNNAVGRQNGWRIIYTTPTLAAPTTHTWYGTPKVWRDDKNAICQNSSMETYYVFNKDTLTTQDPKIIQSHTPIESASTPAGTGGSSGTIGANGQRWIKNAANIAGTEIIYGHTDFDGTRAWSNDNIYIVRDYPVPSALTLDRN
jgi:hypothetical protein